MSPAFNGLSQLDGASAAGREKGIPRELGGDSRISRGRLHGCADETALQTGHWEKFAGARVFGVLQEQNAREVNVKLD